MSNGVKRKNEVGKLGLFPSPYVIASKARQYCPYVIASLRGNLIKREAIDTLEKEYLIRLLEENKSNVANAARKAEKRRLPSL